MSNQVTMEANPRDPAWHMRTKDYRKGYLARMEGKLVYEHTYWSDSIGKTHWKLGWVKGGVEMAS